MDNRRLRLVLITGFLVITGVLVLQGLWLRKAFTVEQSRLDEDIHIALLEVVKELYSGQPLPQNNPVKRISPNYYAVNTEAEIDAELLEYFLSVEFERRRVNLDFEYAIYNCQDDEMVYGAYVSQGGKKKDDLGYFPTLDEYVYYFGVRFPGRSAFVASSLAEWIALTVLLLLVLGIYTYSVLHLLRQRRFSAMQRDFINTMAHEFKTPLSSIQMAAGYLDEHPLLQDDPRGVQYTKALLQSSSRLNQEVERILELGKVESNSLPLTLEEFNLKPELENVAKLVQSNYTTLKVDLAQVSDLNLKADNVHLKNVFYNILDNSAKYGAESVTVSARVTDGVVVVDIEDDGPGIPEKERETVFKKFHRSNVNREVKGFGLGLYYVKQVVEAHEGKVSLLDFNVGTKIEIQLKSEG